MAQLHRPIQKTLSNGMPVIFQHHDGGVAATYWWIQTGSGDEKPDEAGFAHFLEHMHFKDTDAKTTGRASSGEMARAIESLGGDINAYTSFDQTVYHVTCAAHHWEKVLATFGGMAKPQKFLKGDFEREREVILEELKKNEDAPSRQLFQSLFSSVFSKHPYGRPVIGFVKTLKAANVSKLEAFYRRQYVSGQMGLILVGPLNPSRIEGLMKQLEKSYGSRVIPKRAAPKSAQVYRRPSEPELRKAPTTLLKKFDVKTPSLAMAFRVPALGHPDLPALDVMSGILGMGELSRLYQRLFYQSSIVTEVSAGLFVPQDPGMFYLSAECENTEQITPSSEQIFEELARLGREGPTDDELERVIANAESERLYSTQTADGVAGRIGFLKFIVDDFGYDRDYLDDLKGVDAESIRKAALTYFVPQRLAITAMVPKDSEGLDLGAISSSAAKVLGGVAKPSRTRAQTSREGLDAPRSSQWKLPSGITMIHLENTTSHVVSMHAAMLGGLRLELANPIESAARDWGASYLMALTWSKGTHSKDSRAIAQIVEGSAAGLDGFSGRNTVGVSSTGLARDWDKLSNLFTEVLVDAEFPESEVDHSRRVAEDSVRGIDDHSAQLCSKLFLSTLFETHPYGHLPNGSLESLRALDSKKLKAFHRAWLSPERLVVTVVGNVRRKKVEAFGATLEKMLGQFKAQGGDLRSAQFKLPQINDEAALAAPRWVEKRLGREQTHIIVGGLGTTMASRDRQKIQILENVLGGQSGRLFIELREKKSLAYTVSPIHFDGVERGYVGTYIACSPSKKDEALVGIKDVLSRLVEKGPSEAEMKRAKEYFLGRRAMDLQSDSALAAHYGLEAVYGIPDQSDREIVREVDAITANEVREVCAKYWVEPHQVTSVVG